LRLAYRLLLAILLLLPISACHRSERAPQKQYRLTGKIVALNAKDRTATIDAAAIPNFMGAMTMEYPIRSKSEFKTLHVGERISATVNVREDGVYDLSNIHPQNAVATQ
jgi:Cu/Ag efflux protein CusF